ncbi:phosphotransferase family protein [[Mycobacterium] burgundiense]|uniref:Phosphotransferase n=1 Tax=[Mycobacterium] burgundiense TaxID=3064286 RepID=A0ABM9LHP1_9MYCO|nr:phosphotransferase [Mycolicibacterium sp. MU0053]CAJ1499179.1 phosphotransferase [Mycolicibacterium sp. MU0053]
MVNYSSAPAPTTAADVTTGWLTRCLQQAGHDVEVTDFRAQPIGNGMMAAAQRFTMTFTGEAKTAPKTLVLKYAPDGEASRRTGRLGFGFAGRPGFYEQEVRFYRDLAPKLEVRVPRSYAQWIAPECDQFVLLLEDIAPASPGDEFAALQPAELHGAMVNLAGLHAPLWNGPFPEGDNLLKPPTAEEGLRYQRIVARNIEHFRSALGIEPRSATDRVLGRFVERADRWWVSAGRPKSLVHGDYRPDNMLLPTCGASRPVVVDWQTVSVAHSGRDLGGFLGASTPTDVRREHQHDLLRTYQARLAELGVTGYSAEDCLLDLRLGAFHGLQNNVSIARAVDMNERGWRLVTTWLDRLLATFDDLDSLDALDDLEALS